MLLNKLSKFLDNAVDSGLAAKVADYLVRFGYVSSDKIDSLEDIAAAIRRFHKMAGLSESDTITPKTLKAMVAPRCNLSDMIVSEEAGSIPKWGISKLNYYIASRDSEVPANEWDATIAAALSSIEKVCGLQFYQVDSLQNANLVYDTGRGRNDDFDGPSGVLAWFQLPSSSSFRGQVLGKFDQDETWVTIGRTGRGILLQNVAAHETIHGLGVSHTDVPGSLMNPFYSTQIAVPQAEDIRQLRDLRYGPPVVSTKPTVPSTPETPPPSNGNVITINITGSVSKIDIPGYRIQKMG